MFITSTTQKHFLISPPPLRPQLVAYNHCNNVCENGGTCHMVYGEASCECAAGYAGIFCQEEYGTI